MTENAKKDFELLEKHNKIYREARRQVLEEVIEFLIQKYSEVALDHEISDIEKQFWGNAIHDTQEIKNAL